MSYVRERPWIEGGESVVMVLRLLGGAVDQGGNDRDVEAMAEMLRVFAEEASGWKEEEAEEVARAVQEVRRRREMRRCMRRLRRRVAVGGPMFGG